ncbi:MAG: hypothetical protein RLZZ453_875 [Chlamydiota bacterium]
MKILIIKTSAIGDILQTFPVLEYLKTKFADAQVDWIAERPSHALLEAHPLLHTVHKIDTKQRTFRSIRQALSKLRSFSYDLVFDLQGNWKSGIITKLAKAKVKVGWDRSGVQEIGGALFTDYKIPLSLNPSRRVQYLDLVQTYFGDKTPFTPTAIPLLLSPEEKAFPFDFRAPVWMVCTGSKWKNKQLPLASWMELLKQEETPFLLFVHGNSKEEEMAKQLHAQFPCRSALLPRVSLPLLQHIMAKCDLVLSVDSAALHLCATTNTPSLSFFGPSLALCYKPLGDQHRAFQGACPYNKKFHTRCPILRTCSTAACMTFNVKNR